MTTALTYTPYQPSSKGAVEPIVITDAHGAPIYRGTLVRVVGPWNWGNAGDVVLVDGANPSGGLRIKTAGNSETGVAPKNVEVVHDPDGRLALAFELARTLARLAGVDESMSVLIAKKLAIQARLALLEEMEAR